MDNPCMIDDKIIFRLKVKSDMCFGSMWKFRKLADKTGKTFEEIEVQMDAIIEYKEKNVDAENNTRNRHYSRVQRRKLSRAFSKHQRKKIRSGQATILQPSDDTTGSSK